MNIVFLGINDIGMRIYEWLCERETVDVRALVTEPDQLDIIPQISP